MIAWFWYQARWVFDTKIYFIRSFKASEKENGTRPIILDIKMVKYTWWHRRYNERIYWENIKHIVNNQFNDVIDMDDIYGKL